MTGRFVIQWVRTAGSYPFLKVTHRYHPGRRRTVPFIDWEEKATDATSFGSMLAALEEWDRLGYARREYVEVVPV